MSKKRTLLLLATLFYVHCTVVNEVKFCFDSDTGRRWTETPTMEY